MEDLGFPPEMKERIAKITQQGKYYREALDRIVVCYARNDFAGINNALNDIADNCSELLSEVSFPGALLDFFKQLAPEAVHVLVDNGKMSRYYRKDKQ